MSNTNVYIITYRKFDSAQGGFKDIRTDLVCSPRFNHILYKAIRSMAFFLCDENDFSCDVTISRVDLAKTDRPRIVICMAFSMFDYSTGVHISDFSTGVQKVWNNWAKQEGPRVWENMNK